MEKKYKLGIPFIDEQHQQLFDIVDKLGDEKITIKNIIEELKKYTEYHFKTEEEYFLSIGFIEADEHIHLHEIFIETINYYQEFPEKLNKGKLNMFLRSWIKNHILHEDMKYIIKEKINK